VRSTGAGDSSYTTAPDLTQAAQRLAWSWDDERRTEHFVDRGARPVLAVGPKRRVLDSDHLHNAEYWGRFSMLY
jgi:hypothetical protein